MKKWLNKLLIMTFIAFTLISPIQVQAAGKNRYYAVALADPNSMMTSYQIFKVDDQTKPSSYEKYINFKGNYIDMPKNDEYVKYKWPNIPYSNESSETATDRDYEQADAIMAEATNQINTLINWLDRWSADGLVSGYKDDIKTLYSDLSKLLSAGSAKIAGTNFTAKAAESDNPVYKKFMEKVNNVSNSPFKGVGLSDFVVISSPDLDGQFKANKDSSITILTRFPKGYGTTEGEQKFTVENITGYPFLLLSDLTTTISNAFKEKLDFSDFTVVSSTAQMMDEMFGGFTTNVLNFLGFDEPQELVFSEGERATGYYLGLMPNSWWSSVNQFFWVAEIIAILILFMSVINMILKQNLATISPTIRNSLKDSIAQLCIAILLLLAYVPIFYIMAKINVLLVELFKSFAVTVGFNNSAPSMNWLLKFILVAINMGLVIKLNIDYFVRAVMIGFLHATAPIFISSIAMGPSGKKMFNSWITEMIGSIFMQAFDALILAIMMTTIGGGVGSHWWHTQAMIFMLSSLNSWFRNLIGVGNSISSIGGQVKQQADKGWDQAKKIGGTVAGVAVGAAAGGAAGLSSSHAGKSMQAGMEAQRIQSGGMVSNSGVDTSGPKAEGNLGSNTAQKPESSNPKEALQNAQTAQAEVNTKITNYAQGLSKNDNTNNPSDKDKPNTPKESSSVESKNTLSNNSSTDNSSEIDVADLMRQNEESERLENESENKSEDKGDSITPTRGSIDRVKLAREFSKSVQAGVDENREKHNAGSKVDVSNIGTSTSEGSKQNNIPSKESSIKEAENRKMYEERMGVVNNETQSAAQTSTTQTSTSQRNPQGNSSLPSSDTSSTTSQSSLSQETPVSTVSTDQRVDVSDQTTSETLNNEVSSIETPSVDTLNNEMSDNEVSINNNQETFVNESTEETTPQQGTLNNSPVPDNISDMTPEQILNSIDESKLTAEQKTTFNELKKEHKEATTNLENAQNTYAQKLQEESSDEAKKARRYGNMSRGLNAFSQSMLKSSLHGTGLDAVVSEFGQAKTEKYREMSEFSVENQYNIGKKSKEKQTDEPKTEIKDENGEY